MYLSKLASSKLQESKHFVHFNSCCFNNFPSHSINTRLRGLFSHLSRALCVKVLGSVIFRAVVETNVIEGKPTAQQQVCLCESKAQWRGSLQRLNIKLHFVLAASLSIQESRYHLCCDYQCHQVLCGEETHRSVCVNERYYQHSAAKCPGFPISVNQHCACEVAQLNHFTISSNTHTECVSSQSLQTCPPQVSLCLSNKCQICQNPNSR